jgi:hypothetical protein
VRAESRWASLLVFENRTKIAKAEREWMERRVNAALDTQDRICLLQIMTGHGGARFGAVLDGEAAGVMMRLLKHLRRKGGALLGPRHDRTLQVDDASRGKDLRPRRTARSPALD